ncbi:MAG: MBL fold metallo-hydrolase [Bacteroidales bacterium]|nr:MBL fold metallo-hydrolase [Bacteroidales bacterium]
MRAQKLVILITGFLFIVNMTYGQKEIEKDIFETSGASLELWFIGHGTLMFKYGDLLIHIDPVSREADYSTLPDADLILITHEHGDHLDPVAIKELLKDSTKIICNEASSTGLADCLVMANGDVTIYKGINIKAVPAYNITNERSPGNPFHPRGNGNGYILDLGDKRIYVAGDTENIPEMKGFRDIDIAFLPVNLPYTMSPAMAADAALMIKPDILYPYHLGSTNTGELVRLLEGSGIDVRIKKLQ